MEIKKSSRNKIDLNLVKSRVVKIMINPKTIVYIDEWYLEELVDIIKQFPEEKYVELINAIAENKKLKKDKDKPIAEQILVDSTTKKKKKSMGYFPQESLASHRVSKRDSFNEFKTMQEYIQETWFNNEKESLLKVSSVKKMHVKFSNVGAVPHIPSYLNNLSPNNMLSFIKEKSVKFKKATILINISGHMHWKDYKKIIRQFFKMYDFESLSIGNISKTIENDVEYYRISVVKIRNGVNVNGQGLMFESADFLRRIMFMIYEIDPTDETWQAYGNTVLNAEIEELKKKEPYFATILEKYLNPSIILVE